MTNKHDLTERTGGTIAHDFLDIETELGVTDSDYQILDDIIVEAQKRIEVKPEYTKVEAIDVLKTIDDTLKDMGFEYQSNPLLNHGLKTKQINSNHYSAIYLAIADTLKLPLKVVNASGHVFVRWHFDDGKYVNWETTNAEGNIQRYKEALEGYDIALGLNPKYSKD